MSSRSFALIHRPQAWMYDADSMAQLPQRVGFGDVVRCSYRQGECPDVERLDTCSESFLLEANAQQVGYPPMATVSWYRGAASATQGGAPSWTSELVRDRFLMCYRRCGVVIPRTEAAFMMVGAD